MSFISSRGMDVPLLSAGRRGGTIGRRKRLSLKGRITFLLSFSVIGYGRGHCNRIPVHEEGGTMALGFMRTAALSRPSCGMFLRIAGADRDIFGSHSLRRKMTSLESICIREHNSFGRRLKTPHHWGPLNLNEGKHSFSTSSERSETSAISMVRKEMRPHVMKLHTKSQAPDEGQALEKEGTKKFSKLSPKRSSYLQFLVDCKLVYSTFVNAIARNPCLSTLRRTGLERTSALNEDIAWMLKKYPEELGMTSPEPSSEGMEYADYIFKISEESIPRFICHYYNYHFAHTVGGITINRRIANTVLDDHKLQFYCWDRDIGSVKSEVKHAVDELSKEWSRQEKDECIQETEQAFNYGANLLRSVL